MQGPAATDPGYRYQDSLLQRDDARKLASRVVALRKFAKQEWLVGVLPKAAQGDFAAVRYFKKRQGIQGMHATYMHKAGGPQRAVMELQALYASKYTPLEENDSEPARAILHAHVAHQSPPLTSITAEEFLHALSFCKLGKSCGSDGVPYELLQCIMQTDLKWEFIEMFNAIVDGSYPVPENWLTNRVHSPKFTWKWRGGRFCVTFHVKAIGPIGAYFLFSASIYPFGGKVEARNAGAANPQECMSKRLRSPKACIFHVSGVSVIPRRFPRILA